MPTFKIYHGNMSPLTELQRKLDISVDCRAENIHYDFTYKQTEAACADPEGDIGGLDPPEK